MPIAYEAVSDGICYNYVAIVLPSYLVSKHENDNKKNKEESSVMLMRKNLMLVNL